MGCKSTDIRSLNDGFQLADLKKDRKFVEGLKQEDISCSPIIKQQITAVFDKIRSSGFPVIDYLNTNKEDCGLIQFYLKSLKLYEGQITGKISPSFENALKQAESQKLFDFTVCEKVDDSTDIINQFFKEIVSKYKKQLETPGGLSLNIDVIYKDIVEIVEGADGRLNNGNRFKGDIKIIFDNFMRPEEKGKKNIRFVIESMLMDHIEINEDFVESSANVLKSAIGGLYDISLNADKSKTDFYLGEMKKNPVFLQYLSQFPDFESILNMIPEISRTIDKKHLMDSLDRFIANTKDGFIKILNAASKEDITPEVKLGVLRGINEFTQDLINEQNIDILYKELEKISFIKSNDLSRKIVGLLNHPNLSPKDKLEIARIGTDFIKLLTDSRSHSPLSPLYKSFKEDINGFLNGTILKVSAISSKLDPKIIADIIVEINKSFVGFDEKKFSSLMESTKKSAAVINDLKTSYDNNDFFSLAGRIISGGSELTGVIFEIISLMNGKDESNTDFWELVSILKDNGGLLIEGLVKLLNNEFTTGEEFVSFIVSKNVLGRNMIASNGKLIERINNIMNKDISGNILNLKDKLLSSFEGGVAANIINEKIDQNLPNPLANKFLKQFIGEGKIFLKEQLLGKNQELKGVELTSFIFGFFERFSSQNKKDVMEIIKSYGINISEGNYEIVVGKFLEFIKRPETMKILTVILNNISLKLDKSDDIMGEFRKIFDDFRKNGLNSENLGNSNREMIVRNGVDFVYDSFSDPKTVDLLYDLLPNNMKAFKKSDLSKILLSIKSNVSRNILGEIIINELKSGKNMIDMSKESLGGFSLKLKNPNFLLDIVLKIAEDKRVNISGLRKTFIDLGLINKIGTSEGSGNLKVDATQTDKFVDLLHITTSDIQESELSEIASQIGLDKMFGKAAAVLIADIKTIPKEDLKKILKNNLPQINSLLKSPFSQKNQENTINAVYKLTDEIYSKISPEKRISMLEKLSSVGILKPLKASGEGPKLRNFNEKNIENIAGIIYSTIEDKDNPRLGNLLNEILIQNGLGNILDIRLFGKTVGENTVIFLKSIGKENFTKLLRKNQDRLNIFFEEGSDKISISAVLGKDFLGYVDKNKLKSYITPKDNTMDSLMIDLLPYAQHTLAENERQIEGVVKKGVEISGWLKNIDRVSLSNEKKQEIKEYSGQIFDILNKFTGKLPEKYLSGKLDFESGGSGNLMTAKQKGALIWEFVTNNFGFIFGELISSIFQGFDKGRIIQNYFNDKSNKKNFLSFVGDTLEKIK